MARGRWGHAAIAVTSLAACDALFGIQEGQPASTGSGVDASVEAAVEAGVEASIDGSSDSNAEATVEASTDSGGPDTSPDAPTCAGPTIYVSVSTGSDSNAGCTNSAPKKSIAAAIAAAAAAGTVTSIEVCKGVYNEIPLALQTATSLLGGYSCTSWTRTATYGYPTFDGANGTVIQNAAVSTSAVTLYVSGAAVTSSTVVDGFTILGATSGVTATSVVAVLVTGGAAPTLSNNEVTGGSLTVPSLIGSIGVNLFQGGNPTITNNKINGGSGTVPTTSTETGHASVGIQTDGTSTSVQIIDNVINGGSGAALNSSSDGSVAAVLQGPSTGNGPTYTVRGNTIVAGTGTSTGGAATAGLDLYGAETVVVASNSIDGGGGSTGTRCGIGLLAQITGTVTITGNRIYGGNCSIASTPDTAPVGLKVLGPATTALVDDNMIHSGVATNVPTYGPTAILLAGSLTGTTIRHNTLVSGTSNGVEGQALWLDVGTSGSTVVNNILAGTSTNWGVNISQCPGDAGPPALAAFENNLIFGTTGGLVKWASSCYGGVGYATIDSATASLVATQTGATVGGNVTIASSCTTDAGTDSGCVVSSGCTSPQACLTTFFSGWDVASLGYKNLFPATPFAGSCPTPGAPPTSLPPAGNGWTIAATPTPPCKVTRSSVADGTLTGNGVDLYGNCRTSTPSMGAEEDSTATCM
ncbi:MAG: right-handed parallel beta-helix repeat-containing protein [Polyangiaceae bacterium]